MKKRFTFICWNCNRKYTLHREITNQQSITVACPFCKAEGVVDLRPYPRKTTILKMEGGAQTLTELDLPDELPTQAPPAEGASGG